MKVIGDLCMDLETRALLEEGFGRTGAATMFRAQREAVLEMARRDWSARVIDSARLNCSGRARQSANLASRPDAPNEARLSTAQALFEDLPETERQAIGECP